MLDENLLDDNTANDLEQLVGVDDFEAPSVVVENLNDSNSALNIQQKAAKQRRIIKEMISPSNTAQNFTFRD